LGNFDHARLGENASEPPSDVTLSPPIRPDVRSWPSATGDVVVVRIDPVAVPPCITIDGGVYDRLPGQTRPVQTHEGLARLFDRGWRARGSADAAASRDGISSDACIRIVTATTGHTRPAEVAAFIEAIGDVGSKVFTRDVPDWSNGVHYAMATRVDQDGMTLGRGQAGGFVPIGRRVRIARSGAVSIERIDRLSDARRELLNDPPYLARPSASADGAHPEAHHHSAVGSTW